MGVIRKHGIEGGHLRKRPSVDVRPSIATAPPQFLANDSEEWMVRFDWDI